MQFKKRIETFWNFRVGAVPQNYKTDDIQLFEYAPQDTIIQGRTGNRSGKVQNGRPVYGRRPCLITKIFSLSTTNRWR